MTNYALAGGGGTAWYALILVSNDEIGGRAMVRKVSAAGIGSLGVAPVPVANPALGGSARALLPVGAWGSCGGLRVGPYDGLSARPYDEVNLGPYIGICRRVALAHIVLDVIAISPNCKAGRQFPFGDNAQSFALVVLQLRRGKTRVQMQTCPLGQMVHDCNLILRTKQPVGKTGSRPLQTLSPPFDRTRRLPQLLLCQWSQKCVISRHHRPNVTGGTA